jgi:hypothetical protein
MDLMNLIIREGKSWPFDIEFATLDEYRAYFLSHTAFVVRASEDGVDAEGQPSPAGDVLGSFYVSSRFQKQKWPCSYFDLLTRMLALFSNEPGIFKRFRSNPISQGAVLTYVTAVSSQRPIIDSKGWRD